MAYDPVIRAFLKYDLMYITATNCSLPPLYGHIQGKANVDYVVYPLQNFQLCNKNIH